MYAYMLDDQKWQHKNDRVYDYVYEYVLRVYLVSYTYL